MRIHILKSRVFVKHMGYLKFENQEDGCCEYALCDAQDTVIKHNTVFIVAVFVCAASDAGNLGT